MSVTRRSFVLGSVAGLLPSGCSLPTGTIPSRDAPFDVFSLGVASGDPQPQGVVLWTRVAPEPLSDTFTDDDIPVDWAVSRNERMDEPVVRGGATARAASSHCIHVEVDGLEPNTEYFYQFAAMGERSRVGRTRTLPSIGAPTDAYSIALVSCQDYSAGYFTAYRDIVTQNPDLIVHVGDYIYETGGGSVRPYPVAEAMTLSDYRALYAQYRLDPELQDAHAQLPWAVIWDDHEVVNDWGPDHYLPSSLNAAISGEAHRERKNAALQAFFEYMPIRVSNRSRAGDTRIYGQTAIGDLAELNRLDVRSFRSRPACVLDERNHFRMCAEAQDPSRSLLGLSQESWLAGSLGQTDSSWRFLVQASVMAPLDVRAGPEIRHEADGWDNYAAARQRLINLIVNRRLRDVVSLGGNIHAFYAGVVYDRRDEAQWQAVLTEIVTTSVTASGGGEERYRDILGRRGENPGLQYFDNRYRGYALLNITPESISARLRTVDDIGIPGSAVRTLKTLDIPRGAAGIVVHDGDVPASSLRA